MCLELRSRKRTWGPLEVYERGVVLNDNWGLKTFTETVIDTPYIVARKWKSEIKDSSYKSCHFLFESTSVRWFKRLTLH